MSKKKLALYSIMGLIILLAISGAFLLINQTGDKDEGKFANAKLVFLRTEDICYE